MYQQAAVADTADLQRATAISHIGRITDYLSECDRRRERTSRVIAAGGVKGALDAMFEASHMLRGLTAYTTPEIEAATESLIELVRDLITYTEQVNLKPLHLREVRRAW